MLTSCLDLTSLGAADTDESIRVLCQRAQRDSGHVAALCCYPQFLKTAQAHLPEGVALATVVNFPEGSAPLSEVLAQIAAALQAGANEIDLVIPYQDVLNGEFASSIEMVKAAKARCGAAPLKVIIESGELKHSDLIERLSYALLEAGADFIKTSTGKVSVGATPEAVSAILKALARYQQKTGQLKGLKVSGGVRTPEQAQIFMDLVSSVFGLQYLQPVTFRVGTSSL